MRSQSLSRVQELVREIKSADEFLEVQGRVGGVGPELARVSAAMAATFARRIQSFQCLTSDDGMLVSRAVRFPIH